MSVILSALNVMEPMIAVMEVMKQTVPQKTHSLILHIVNLTSFLAEMASAYLLNFSVMDKVIAWTDLMKCHVVMESSFLSFT